MRVLKKFITDINTENTNLAALNQQLEQLPEGVKKEGVAEYDELVDKIKKSNDKLADLKDRLATARIEIIKEYEIKCKTKVPGWQNFFKAIGMLCIALVGFVIGAAIGMGIGIALGAWSGPGAFVTGALTAIAAGTVGASLALSLVTAGASLAGAVTGIISGIGFFNRKHVRKDADKVARAGKDFVDPEFNQPGHSAPKVK